MASNGPYADADPAIPQLGGASNLYANQNGTPPAQQQQHDSDIQLHEGLQQIQRNNEMMQAGGPPAHQMNALSAAHHQFQTPPRPTHSPQQMAQTVMSLGDEHMGYDHDGSSRKRSKVSRACDECRRKKIRCDATNENGPEACSSCKRTGARCQFSRQPMKRGPSKGYIKELADRLNSLENQIQQPHSSSQGYDFAAVEQSLADAQSPQYPRKRTHSMSEGFQDSYSRPNWSGQDRGIDYDIESQILSRLTSEDHPSNGTGANLARRASFGETALAGSLITSSNEGTIKAYYSIIHPTLPILPHDSSSLSRLTFCPAKLREAFFLSLECSIRSSASKALPATEISLNQLIHQCSEAVDAAKHILSDADSSREFYNTLVYCQSLALLALASDRPGPGTVGNTAELLGRLAGCITDLSINDAKVLKGLREHSQETFDAARRLFWVSLIMDRLHASSRSKDISLPLQAGFVSRDDLNALGEDGYHLARVADVIGQVAYITRASNIPNIDPSSPFAFAALSATTPSSVYLNGQLSRLRESLEIANLPANSPPQLTFQYLRLLVSRQAPHTASTEMFSLTKEFLGGLMDGSAAPVHHIFASLVATSLTELSDRVETQVEAHAAIKEMSDALANGQIIQRSLDGLGWDVAIRDLLNQKKPPTPQKPAPEPPSAAVQPNMVGLQHLAAAAVGERGGTDARPASSGGGNNGVTATAQIQKVEHDITAAVAAANEAAKAQATAAAAQQQMQGTTSNSNSNGGSNYDSSALLT
ncbi:hypothetical protein BDV95DRAFT_627127 [Massariosphaeria phaeospora]|uniref:Zn(2)-C6 fungal-type domain-containing protein n=1 Tax=Massariosphaeria phaeospora TaxID=100035 RepID=A0A7C8ME67_9PLEO|nr:hypothetical protein BDV95DRAFT_627127 [Massariosphaeria phaeospora]